MSAIYSPFQPSSPKSSHLSIITGPPTTEDVFTLACPSHLISRARNINHSKTVLRPIPQAQPDFGEKHGISSPGTIITSKTNSRSISIQRTQRSMGSLPSMASSSRPDVPYLMRENFIVSEKQAIRVDRTTTLSVLLRPPISVISPRGVLTLARAQ
ncbi:hypothetical protein LTR84_012890 [Exophiala bonariae]|uniref:Uncharacterized protein n=1 Tax=Exophiala bonariae TaxID=1690606 RepID=A0AAV9ND99_9EURO|nr:hypothetical protein LTR84_012890 [Exophiala bonariae]